MGLSYDYRTLFFGATSEDHRTPQAGNISFLYCFPKSSHLLSPFPMGKLADVSQQERIFYY